jgi:death-on-curing protein
MPHATFGGQLLHEFPHGMAAAYLFHIVIVANHPFVDGNKRAGLACALVFLDLHGFRLDCEKEIVQELVLGVASGQVSKDECVRFFEKHVKASTT